jgi:hypothetical protein
VVQKLNRDFFDPALSCGPAQLAEVRRYLWWLLPDTPALGLFGIHGTLVVETAIPLLLCSRARHSGIALALGFHWVLGAGYARFSAMLIAPLVLFVDPALLRAGAEAWRRRVAPAVDRRCASLVAGALAMSYVALASVSSGPPTSAHGLRVVTHLWLVYGAMAAAVFGGLWWQAGGILTATTCRLRPAPLALALAPLLLAMCGLAPHLGLKNTQAFAMYSNLRTENGATNHLFLPATLQVFPYTRDLVTVLEASDPVLARLVRRQWQGHAYFFAYVAGAADLPSADAPRWTIPFPALQRRVTELARSGQTGVRIVYERGGTRYERRNAELDPDLARASWLARKFWLLRAVPMTERGYCMW